MKFKVGHIVTSSANPICLFQIVEVGKVYYINQGPYGGTNVKGIKVRAIDDGSTHNIAMGDADDMLSIVDREKVTRFQDKPDDFSIDYEDLRKAYDFTEDGNWRDEDVIDELIDL